jgi:hypothetical protein
MNKDVIIRERALEILSTIARDAGNAAMDRIRAVETLARMNGWNQPLRVELSAADFQVLLKLLCAQAVSAGATLSRKRCALPLGDGENDTEGQQTFASACAARW